MRLEPSADQGNAASRWRDLSPWERAELGRSLRNLGWSYGEIMEVIPVAKSTLSNWCRDIPITPEQAQAILARTGSRKGIPRDTQRKRNLAIAEIRSRARLEVTLLIENSFWIAGTVMYWAEGAKTGRALQMSNSDPRALRLFIDWVRRFHCQDAEFVLQLHLHEGNDETHAKDAWITALPLDPAEASFHRTFIKPKGTGYRKNHLAHGVCRVRLRRGTDAFIRTMVWIETLAPILTDRSTRGGANLAPGR
jgi:hypothetical protein